ncbi:MAG: sulfite exporter TauE/SafE family protein [Candidatus Sulfotelmatobacter sp.]
MGFHLGSSIFLFLAAIIAGTLNAVAGGGSFVSFPALLFLRVPPVAANATNTVALWPGLAASTIAYSKKLNVPLRLLVPLLITSVAGGWAGALLLLHTPPHTFLHLVPWLLLSGTLLFAFGNRSRAIAGKRGAIQGLHSGLHSDDLQSVSWMAVAVSSIVELLVAIYGGYFGAGIGFITLGMLAALGMRDIHAMGAIRTLLAATINAVAVLTFIVAGAVLWRECVVMIAGALTGGWFGAHYAQKADPRRVRAVVIALGFVMTAYFFVTTR